MNQKQITALLLACLVIVSFMCYQQAKKIDDMEMDISHLEDRIDTLEEKGKDFESEIEELKLSISAMQEDIEDNFLYRQRPPIRR